MFSQYLFLNLKKQTLNLYTSCHIHTCSFAYFLKYVPLFLNDNDDEECESISGSKTSASGCYLAFA